MQLAHVWLLLPAFSMQLSWNAHVIWEYMYPVKKTTTCGNSRSENALTFDGHKVMMYYYLVFHWSFPSYLCVNEFLTIDVQETSEVEKNLAGICDVERSLMAFQTSSCTSTCNVSFRVRMGSRFCGFIFW